MREINKTIWLLWLQGWDNIGWLTQQVLESWELNNPGWKVVKLCEDNLREYTSGIEYMYDPSKNITPQAKSDIIRLSLLKNHGGVWADATLLCMQPLDSWIYDAIEPSGIWMYHGTGGGMDVKHGPASWFIVSQKNNYMIERWKTYCDMYWKKNNKTDNYYWLDAIFKALHNNDKQFREIWSKVPYINCEEDGQSHCMAYHDKMVRSDEHIKELFRTKPPYALKFWKKWYQHFPDSNSEVCQESNGYYAITMSKRTDIVYKHFG